jgi:hypothetical protein
MRQSQLAAQPSFEKKFMSLDLDQVFITILYYNNFPVQKPPPLSSVLDWPVLLRQS